MVFERHSVTCTTGGVDPGVVPQGPGSSTTAGAGNGAEQGQCHPGSPGLWGHPISVGGQELSKGAGTEPWQQGLGWVRAGWGEHLHSPDFLAAE